LRFGLHLSCAKKGGVRERASKPKSLIRLRALTTEPFGYLLQTEQRGYVDLGEVQTMTDQLVQRANADRQLDRSSFSFAILR
jgi:hypothetical protein